MSVEISKKEMEIINAKCLIDYVLIFAQNNSDKFFKTVQMKGTSYTKKDLDNLTHNYIHHRKLKISE
ncbi:MAG TPA: hypothetical protein DCM10_08295 [Xanthomarina gelatinilytica]|nr:hypothetical protein [Xanthomarina gelatinilytica]|tara:strand:- start:111 stop:311 length:201 start_codon:yes stop_codon:yes gene_type:complete